MSKIILMLTIKWRLGLHPPPPPYTNNLSAKPEVNFRLTSLHTSYQSKLRLIRGCFGKQEVGKLVILSRFSPVYSHCKEDPIDVFPEIKLRSKIGGPILGIYKSLTDT
jgi:hypothetical protein